MYRMLSESVNRLDDKLNQLSELLEEKRNEKEEEEAKVSTDEFRRIEAEAQENLKNWVLKQEANDEIILKELKSTNVKFNIEKSAQRTLIRSLFMEMKDTREECNAFGTQVFNELNSLRDDINELKNLLVTSKEKGCSENQNSESVKSEATDTQCTSTESETVDEYPLLPGGLNQRYSNFYIFKNCPKCTRLVNKTDESNHVKCSCGAFFCWVCLFQASESRPIYAHMKEEHGCHGGNYDIPEFEDGNIDVQRAIAENLRFQPDDEFDQEEEGRLNRNLNLAEQQQAPQLENSNNGPAEERQVSEDSYLSDEENDEEEQKRLHEEQDFTAELTKKLTLVKRQQDNRSLPPASKVQLFDSAVGFPQTTPTIPNPPQIAQRFQKHLNEFPSVLLEKYPVYYKSKRRRAALLKWINESDSQYQHDHRMRELFRYAENNINLTV
ncbi:hypothetical protein GCK72_006719 [Caenorhabditis remanei]|uniref:IBR domain-containing protein n=1 Tax=Caenorhabditis remanei TaxID=31234 RepID=A0A6A5HI30_CAERE|nr:hypothetical protein GCK72_006719 [Caenorhabditis remanei]KAF1766761.1 hypothetical protein GCK72_006719 [Caenorhabditis remanei]